MCILEADAKKLKLSLTNMQSKNDLQISRLIWFFVAWLPVFALAIFERLDLNYKTWVFVGKIFGIAKPMSNLTALENTILEDSDSALKDSLP